MILKKKRDTITVALLLLLGLLVYAGCYRIEFQHDDYMRIVDNPFIKHINPAILWKHNPTDFITNLSFAVDYQLFKFHLTGWHAVNLLLHILNSILVYFFVLYCMRSPLLQEKYSPNEGILIGVFSSFLFLLHPIQTQAVVYLVQRTTLLCSTFYLLGLTYYLKAKLTNENRYYIYSVFLVLLGMFTKPSFATFPISIIMLNIFFFGVKKRFESKEIFSFLFFCIPLICIPLLLTLNGILYKEAIQGFKAAPLNIHWLTQPSVMLTYLRLFLLPINQNLDYDFPPVRDVSSMTFWIPCCFILLIIFWAWRTRRKFPLLSFSIFWILTTLSLVMIFPLPDFIYEHWMYLPCVGFACFFSHCVVVSIKRRTLLGCSAVVVLMILSVLTVNRVRVWSDSETFLKDVISKSPLKARPHNNLGLVYLKKNKLKEAEHEFSLAYALDSDYHLAVNNLALVYQKQNKLQESINLVKSVVRNYPENTDASLNLANILTEQGKIKQAMSIIERLRKSNPFNATLHISLANIYARQNKVFEAEKQYRIALWLNPQSATAHFNFGNLKYNDGSLYDALLHYKEAIRLEPQMDSALNNIGHIYFYFHDYRNAVEAFQRAVDVNSDSPENYYNLANALFAYGRRIESRSMAEKAMSLYRLDGQEKKAQDIELKLKDLQE